MVLKSASNNFSFEILHAKKLVYFDNDLEMFYVSKRANFVPILNRHPNLW